MTCRHAKVPAMLNPRIEPFNFHVNEKRHSSQEKEIETKKGKNISNNTSIAQKNQNLK